MAPKANMSEAPADRVLIITRIFDAPRDLVFRAWTEPEHIGRWLAPKGFTISLSEGDLRRGGAWRSCMRSPDGVDYRLSGVYREIVKPERIVFTHGWVDADGKRGHETLVTVTLAEQRGKTKLTLHQEVFETVAERDGHQGGWTECLDRLADYLPQME